MLAVGQRLHGRCVFVNRFQRRGGERFHRKPLSRLRSVIAERPANGGSEFCGRKQNLFLTGCGLFCAPNRIAGNRLGRFDRKRVAGVLTLQRSGYNDP